MSPRGLFPRSGSPARMVAAFDAFWATYPPRRPNPRAMAEVAFAKVVRGGVDPAHLTQAAAAYATECAASKLDPAFIVHARTWLHQARYQDYPPFSVSAPPSAPASPPEPDHPLWPYVRGTISAVEFRTFLAPCELRWLVSPDEPPSGLCLIFPTAFARDHAQRHYAHLIGPALLREGRSSLMFWRVATKGAP